MSSEQRKYLKGFDIEKTDLKRAKNGEGVQVFQLDLTASCPLDCVYCGNADRRKLVEPNLSLQHKKNAVSEARDLGAQTVLFSGEGEPTIDPDFKEIIKHNYELGLTTVVFTSMVTIDDEFAQFLYDHDVSLALKVDTLDESVYKELTGKDCFDKFKRGLCSVIKTYGQDLDNLPDTTRLEVSMVLTQKNEKDVEAVKQFCDGLGIPFWCKTPAPVGNAKKNWDSLVGSEKDRLASMARENTDVTTETHFKTGSCGVSNYGLMLSRYGRLGICAGLPIPDQTYPNQTLKQLLATKMKISDAYPEEGCMRKHILKSDDPFAQTIKSNF